MAGGPVLALVGATGLVGSALLRSFLDAVSDSRLSSLRILTTSPASPKLASARAHPAGRVEIREIHYSDTSSLDAALAGVDVLVSAMGAQSSPEGTYESNKHLLLDAAVRAGVRIYVPSEWGTDHNGANQDAVQSPMFANKQAHHAEAQQRGLQVLAVYNALILEISFSDWLGISTGASSTEWTVPRPEHPVAFTSLRDLGPFTLSAVLQTWHAPSSSAAPIPSRLRIYSDLLTLDKAADLWEEIAGGTVKRNYVDSDGLKKRYQEVKPTLPPGMLGPAIPLMISLGGFDYSQDSANSLLNTGEYAFEPRTVRDFLAERAREIRQAA
ncbi:uncharacterized protein JCM10292_005059 [Rhodotorula paludigena]|uniref:uncharacterized protein n=1 Tax=Rhodotorula paludigena TaxID=86838 RepID=UPI00316C3BCE